MVTLLNFSLSGQVQALDGDIVFHFWARHYGTAPLHPGV